MRRMTQQLDGRSDRFGRFCRGMGMVGVVAALAAPAIAPAADLPRRPNIVIILGDDLGFADLGSFGGEIKTPNFDNLAKEGVRFANFYTHASCSPTRSMMLSGVDTHLNGLGNMNEWTAPNQRGAVGYEGYLNHRVATLPQLLKDAGYHTYMVGKWHMGKQPDQIPAARGFERDFSLLDGAGSYWDMTNFTALTPKSTFTEDGRYLTRLPKDYYATKTYTDKLIGYIDANRGDGKPFFAYVAHQAPHDPYHLPKEWRSRHVGEYDKGWDAIRQERLKRQIELGIMPAGTELAERMWFVPDPIVFAPMSRVVFGRKMELYAGLVENMDYHVGRLIDHLKKIGEYDNTIFIVFGDNGAEGTDLFKMMTGSPGTTNYLFAAVSWSQTNINAWGDPGSYVGYGPMWAQVSMTPFSQYKGWTAEGGIRNALIVSGPVVQRPKAASTTVSCSSATSCRRCWRSPARAIRRSAKTATSCRRSSASRGTTCSPVAPTRRARPATTSPGRSSATERCGRASGNCAGSSSRTARATGSCTTSRPIPANAGTWPRRIPKKSRRCWQSGTAMPRPTT